jgi:long-chain acyl-CoA synthetase
VLTSFFDRVASSQIAIVRSNGASTTYGALREAATRLAGKLADAGAGPGRAVGVVARDPASFVVGALAAWHAEAPVVPLDARAGRASVDASAAKARVVALVDDGETVLPRAEPGGPIDDRSALVLFTSGSSAEPKAVLLGRTGVAANVSAILEYLPVARAPRTAVVVPLSYSYGLVGQVLTTLEVGGALLLLNDVAYPALQVDAMARLDAGGLSSVPASLRLLARAVIETTPGSRPRLAYVASAGAPLDEATVLLVREAFPGARIFNQYGLTEASPRVAATDDLAPTFARGSVGRPLRGLDAWAVSPDGARLPPGEEGELVVRGPSTMLGYLDDPEGTARVLSKDGVLRTGDAARVDEEGYLFVSGRLDGVVKCAGERVSVEEVAALLRTHEGVRDACVVAVPHAELGATLCAYVEGPVEVVPALRKLVRDALAPAKRPSKFVAMAELPRTANGKVARAKLGGAGEGS